MTALASSQNPLSHTICVNGHCVEVPANQAIFTLAEGKGTITIDAPHAQALMDKLTDAGVNVGNSGK